MGMLALFSGLYHLIWCPWDPVLGEGLSTTALAVWTLCIACTKNWSGNGTSWGLGMGQVEVCKWDRLRSGNGTDWGLGMVQIEVWEWDKLRSGNGTSWGLGMRPVNWLLVYRWQVKIEHSRRYLGLRRGAKVNKTNFRNYMILLKPLVFMCSMLVNSESAANKGYFCRSLHMLVIFASNPCQ